MFNRKLKDKEKIEINKIIDESDNIIIFGNKGIVVIGKSEAEILATMSSGIVKMGDRFDRKLIKYVLAVIKEYL